MAGPTRVLDFPPRGVDGCFLRILLRSPFPRKHFLLSNFQPDGENNKDWCSNLAVQPSASPAAWRDWPWRRWSRSPPTRRLTQSRTMWSWTESASPATGKRKFQSTKLTWRIRRTNKGTTSKGTIDYEPIEWARERGHGWAIEEVRDIRKDGFDRGAREWINAWIDERTDGRTDGGVVD